MKNISTPKMIPPGTQVVLQQAVIENSGKIMHPQGAVGVVAKVINEDLYLIRFLDGYEKKISRANIVIRKHFQQAEYQASDSLENHDYYDDIIYRCIVGSRAYGLDHKESDTDRRGIYLPPAHLHWSLYQVPEQLENPQSEECYWELQKFLGLALKANPNILECLYTPLIELATPLAQELLDNRDIFLSKLIYQTYNGYVMSQFKKLNKYLEKHGHIKWKHAMHLIRLLLSGIRILKEGFVPVKVDDYREDLLAIRRGEVSWEAINTWRLDLHKNFDVALSQSSLPERPDYEAANRFLIKARRSKVDS